MKVFLIFLALCINLYGNLVTTNGRIGLYFDEEEMRMHSISGSVFEKPDISYIDFAVLIDGKPYSLRDKVAKVRRVPNTNMLLINGEVEGMKFSTFVIPSSIDRDKLYMSTYIRKGREERDIKMIYRIYPYKNINILDYNSPKDYFIMDDFRMKSLNNPMGMYLSDEEIMENLKFREVRSRVIRYQDDKVLLASQVEGNRRIAGDVFIFDFGKKEWDNRLDFTPSILRDEYTFWQDWNWEYQGYPVEVRQQLTQLRMISMGEPIPQSLSYNESHENLVTNMKLSALLSLYNKNTEALDIMKNYRFSRKNTSEDVVVLASLIKSWEESRDMVGDYYIRTRIYPLFQRILEGIDDEGRFLIEDDNIETYFYLTLIMEELLQNKEYLEYIPEDRVREKLALLKSNIEKNYMTPEGIKNRPSSIEPNPRNIEYLDLYPQSVRREILMDEYSKYYDKRMGLLIFPGEEFIDTEFNLTFARFLYNNSYEKEGEQIFARVKEIVRKNNDYITPKMYPLSDNEAGIYGDLIFSYLLTNYFRGID